MAVSGALALTLFILYNAEAAKGKRVFLVPLREYLDAEIVKRSNGWTMWKKYFGTSSFRLFLHYLLHQGLSASIYLVGFIQSRLHRLRQKNKIVAKVVSSDSDNHLHHIAEHKKSVALTEEEKENLKERSLND